MDAEPNPPPPQPEGVEAEPEVATQPAQATTDSQVEQPNHQEPIEDKTKTDTCNDEVTKIKLSNGTEMSNVKNDASTIQTSTTYKNNDGQQQDEAANITNNESPDDFSYIDDGGFIIECANGEILGLTGDQAALIKKNSQYFTNCFRHGTLEATSKHIKKPDWPVAIARHLVEVLTKGSTTVRNLPLYQEVMRAADQTLADLRLCSLVNYYQPIEQSATQKFLHLVGERKFRFKLRAPVTCEKWRRLLDMDILLFRKETNFVLKLDGDHANNANSHRNVTNEERSKDMMRRKLDVMYSQYWVHAEKTIDALLVLSRVLGESSLLPKNGQRDNPSCTAERFSLYFETNEEMSEDHHELIDRLAGGEAYIRTCPDSYKLTQGYTVSGSFDVLRRAIQPLVDSVKEPKSQHCTLRIDDPTPDTLGRLINASHEAKDYPGSIGLDASKNKYFCRKTISDIVAILDYMADYSTSSAIRRDFQVIQKYSENDVF